MFKSKLTTGVVVLLVALGLTGAESARAEHVPMADGTMWNASSRVEKTAYTVGLNNLLVLEYIYQTEVAEVPPGDDQSAIQQMWRGGDGVTIDRFIDTVDAWYEAHPDELEKPVLHVVWDEIIEPNLNR